MIRDYWPTCEWNFASPPKRWLPAPEFLIRIALGQMSEMLLHGQRAIPKKIVAAGFRFRFPDLKVALENALENIKVV